MTNDSLYQENVEKQISNSVETKEDYSVDGYSLLTEDAGRSFESNRDGSLRIVQSDGKEYLDFYPVFDAGSFNFSNFNENRTGLTSDGDRNADVIGRREFRKGLAELDSDLSASEIREITNSIFETANVDERAGLSREEFKFARNLLAAGIVPRSQGTNIDDDWSQDGEAGEICDDEPGEQDFETLGDLSGDVNVLDEPLESYESFYPQEGDAQSDVDSYLELASYLPSDYGRAVYDEYAPEDSIRYEPYDQQPADLPVTSLDMDVFDNDGDGLVSRREFMQGLIDTGFATNLEVNRHMTDLVFDMYNRDGLHGLTSREFQDASFGLESVRNNRTADWAAGSGDAISDPFTFAEFDTSGDGVVGRKELRTGLSRTGIILDAGVGARVADSIIELANVDNEFGLSEAEFEQASVLLGDDIGSDFIAKYSM